MTDALPRRDLRDKRRNNRGIPPLSHVPDRTSRVPTRVPASEADVAIDDLLARKMYQDARRDALEVAAALRERNASDGPVHPASHSRSAPVPPLTSGRDDAGENQRRAEGIPSSSASGHSTLSSRHGESKTSTSSAGTSPAISLGGSFGSQPRALKDRHGRSGTRGSSSQRESRYDSGGPYSSSSSSSSSSSPSSSSSSKTSRGPGSYGERLVRGPSSSGGAAGAVHSHEPGSIPSGQARPSPRPGSSSSSSAAPRSRPGSAASGGGDGSLVTSLAARLSKLEVEHRRVQTELRERETQMEGLRSTNASLRKALRVSDGESREARRLAEENERLRGQCVAMEAFLQDYGMKWVGERAQTPGSDDNHDGDDDGDDDDDSGDADSDGNAGSKRDRGHPAGANGAVEKGGGSGAPGRVSDASDGAKKQGVMLGDEASGFTFDLARVVGSIEQLNMIAGEDRTKFGGETTGGIRRLQRPRALPLTIFRDGILVEKGPFRPFSDPHTQVFLRDLEDGYFPYELKHAYPDGVPFALTQRPDQDHGGGPGSGIVPGAGGGAAASGSSRNERDRLQRLRDPFPGSGMLLGGGGGGESRGNGESGGEGDKGGGAAEDGGGGGPGPGRNSGDDGVRPPRGAGAAARVPARSRLLAARGGHGGASELSQVRTLDSSAHALRADRGAFLSKLSGAVIRNGRVVDVRDDIARLLSGGSTESHSPSIIVAQTPLVTSARRPSSAASSSSSAIKGRGSADAGPASQQGTAASSATIQVRSEDGTAKFILKLSPTDTVAMIREYLNVERCGERPYELVRPFPRTLLRDYGATLVDAGLVPNATLVMVPRGVARVPL